jgi:AhpD family alkylhydroperoxidase
MDIRIKELIAIGASIAANCIPCLEYHVNKAKENGADDQEIAEAIAVAKMLRKGSASKMDEFILTVLAGTRSGENSSEGGCGAT